MREKPHSMESEQGVLGSLMLDFNRVYDICVNKNVTSSFFYEPKHRTLYENFVSMAKKKMPVDLLTVVEALKRSGQLKAVGGYVFLEKLVDITPTSASAQYYVEFLTNRFIYREWIGVAEQMLNMAYVERDLEDISNFVLKSEKKIDQNLSADQLETECISDVSERLQKRLKIKAPVIQKIPTSINTLRNRIRGYPVGRMTVIASRPAVGKTAMACSESVPAAEGGSRVYVWTGEMSSDEYLARMACIHAKINTADYIDGKLDDEELEMLNKSLEYIATLPIYINDKSMTINAIVRWMHKIQDKADMVIIDHFLLLKMVSKKGQRDSAIYGQWSKELRAAAKDTNVALLLLAQIKRLSSWQGKKAAPSKDDLKETGSLEEDAYLILIIHDKEIKNGDDLVSNYQIIVDKHRNGWNGTVPVEFVKEYAQIKGLGI